MNIGIENGRKSNEFLNWKCFKYADLWRGQGLGLLEFVFWSDIIVIVAKIEHVICCTCFKDKNIVMWWLQQNEHKQCHLI